MDVEKEKVEWKHKCYNEEMGSDEEWRKQMSEVGRWKRIMDR